MQFAATLALYIASSVPGPMPETHTHPFRSQVGVHVIHMRDFKFPVMIDPPRRGQIKEIRLWVSADQGATWRRNGAITPNENFIPFRAPEDGLYWFAIQVIDQDGTTRPLKVNASHVSQKVHVLTTGVPPPPR
jgi:hypothetical protein